MSKLVKIELTESQMELLESNGNVIQESGGSRYMFLPFWFEFKEKGGRAIVHSLDNSPGHIVEAISSMSEAWMPAKPMLPLPNTVVEVMLEAEGVNQDHRHTKAFMTSDGIWYEYNPLSRFVETLNVLKWRPT